MPRRPASSAVITGSATLGGHTKRGASAISKVRRLPREKALQGKYWIQSEEQNLTPVEAVSRYKELMAVERALRDLKDVIEMRPIYHQTPRRVEAHIFVAALALLLKHAVQRKLKQAGMDLSAEEALGALTTVQLLDLELPDGGAKRLVTRGTRRAQQVLQALGIRDRTPPGGPDQNPACSGTPGTPLPCFQSLNRCFWPTWARLRVLPEGLQVVSDAEGENATRRRSVYLLARRTWPLSFLSVFDFPIIDTACSRRVPSATPLQSLTMMNSEFAMENARAAARRAAALAGEDPSRKKL